MQYDLTDRTNRSVVFNETYPLMLRLCRTTSSKFFRIKNNQDCVVVFQIRGAKVGWVAGEWSQPS